MKHTVNTDIISETIQSAGVAGAGGAGFPSHVKWHSVNDGMSLLINLQESEPNCYADAWLAREHADELAEFLQWGLEALFDRIVIGTKQKYRENWISHLEEATDATVYEPTTLPIESEAASGINVAYTPDVYTYGEESVLLMVTAGVQIDDDLPSDYGWIVNNVETLFNITRALNDGNPVTRKYIHVDGNVENHRCLEVPIGTPATDLLRWAGVNDERLDDGQCLVDGGPGWCYEIENTPDEFGVRKRTNAVLVLDDNVVAEHRAEGGEIDVLDTRDWKSGNHETKPKRMMPESVRIPLITNQNYTGFVQPSVPIVEVGDAVEEGTVIAEPRADEFSNTQHASITGTVAEVTETHITIEGN